MNPQPTDPSAPGGGGVGGPGSPINTNPPNDRPTRAPVIQPLTNVVDVTNVTYITKNGLMYARMTFAQPDHAMYAGVLIYYKASRQSFISFEENTVPGIGRDITFDLGPLAVDLTNSLATTYDTYVRVKYTDGQLSTRFVRFTLTPRVGTSTNPSELVVLVGTGWPDISQVVEEGRRDSKFSTIAAVVPSMGSAGTPRVLNITVTQDVISQPANFDVDGVRVYWKLNTATYWKTAIYKFASYSPGSAVDIGFNGDIGVSGGLARYDFAYRFSYKDGSLSTFVAVTYYVVEDATNSYPYSPSFGNATASNRLVTEYPIVTEDQAPPGAVADPLNIRMTIGAFPSGLFFNESAGTTGIRLFVFPPAVTNRADWRGVKIRYRPVVPGQNTALTTFVDKNVKPDANFGLMIYSIWGIQFDQQYEIIITPQVIKSGVEQDSNSSIVGVGYVHNRTLSRDFPLDNNWAPSWNMTAQDTKTALNQAGQASGAGTPTVDIISLMSVSDPYSYSTNAGFHRISSSQVSRNQYVRLVYNGDKIAGLTQLYIYRRFRSTAWGPTGGSPGSGFAQHWGVGRWERVTVTHTGTGNKIVNLRMPTGHDEFAPYYQVSGYGAAAANLYNLLPGETATSPTIVPIPGTIANGNLEFLIVAVISGSASTRGHFHRGYRATNGAVLDLINPNRPEIIDYAADVRTADASYTSGFQRRISEARTTLVAPTNFDTVIARRTAGTSGSVTQVLTTPIDGPAVV